MTLFVPLELARVTRGHASCSIWIVLYSRFPIFDPDDEYDFAGTLHCSFAGSNFTVDPYLAVPSASSLQWTLHLHAAAGAHPSRETFDLSLPQRAETRRCLSSIASLCAQSDTLRPAHQTLPLAQPQPARHRRAPPRRETIDLAQAPTPTAYRSPTRQHSGALRFSHDSPTHTGCLACARPT